MGAAELRVAQMPRPYLSSNMGANMNLEPGQILEQEFEYARETAMQAQNDRTVVVNLYLILVGAVGSLLLALPSFSSPGRVSLPTQAMGVFFILIALLGFLTLFKLIRLRQAWHESARAMNTIKQYYAARFPGLEQAFHWQSTTIPRHDKPWTITFILSLMVILIDSVALGGGIFLLLPVSPQLGLTVTVSAAILAFFLQVAFYSFELGKSDMTLEAQKQKEAEQAKLPLLREYESK